MIYDYGVRISSLKSQNYDLWYCLASTTCTELFKVARNTSNASDHFHKIHAITSQRARNLLKRNKGNKLRLSYEYQVMLRTNPNRFHEIKIVKLIVRKILPFNFGECPEVRTILALLDQKGDFSNEMHSRKVKTVILEMYRATVPKMKRYLCDVINGSALPMLHLNLDLWICSTSHDKYIGIRIFLSITSGYPEAAYLQFAYFVLQ